MTILFALILGYVQSPFRIVVYMLIALFCGCTSVFLISTSDGWFFLIPLIPGAMGISMGGLCAHHFFDPITYNISNAILVGIAGILLIEIPIIFTCYHIGRWFGTKTGNLHRL